MSDIGTRKAALRKLIQLSNRNPDLRICQLISNSMAAELARRDNDVYYIEDADLLKALEEYERKIQCASS